ncbi:hypothetical protein PENTCL1PPCAC_28682, partial [Pristionchus entomophagus]
RLMIGPKIEVIMRSLVKFPIDEIFRDTENPVGLRRVWVVWTAGVGGGARLLLPRCPDSRRLFGLVVSFGGARSSPSPSPEDELDDELGDRSLQVDRRLVSTLAILCRIETTHRSVRERGRSGIE